MNAVMPSYAAELGPAFGLGDCCLRLESHGCGHIHTTLRAAYKSSQGVREVVHQRINTAVFQDPHAVMHNITHVTQTLIQAAKREYPRDWQRRALQLVPTVKGEALHVDSSGACWRTYVFVEHSTTIEQAPSVEQARAAALAFGRFSRALAAYDGPPLHQTIAGFHDTPARWQTFLTAVQHDEVGRRREIAAELDACAALAWLRDRLATPLARGDLPRRIAHNDTKLNNVLVDASTAEPLCVVDLDTVMPGSSLFDFGDLVRSSTSPLAEDARDFGEVVVRVPTFAALAQGWLQAWGADIHAYERELMVSAGAVMAFELSLRFLTDYLAGDRYFKVHYPQHNLVRARTQLALARALVRQENELAHAVQQTWQDRASWQPSSS